MKIISFGCNCYVKWLINITEYKKETDIFDWINSYEFTKLIKSIDDNFDIFKNITKSPLKQDINSENIYYNELYSFRMPHEKDINDSIINYQRRFERFNEYKNVCGNYLFIRYINHNNNFCENEILENNYNEKTYNEIFKYLPINSKILLITEYKLSNEDKKKIYDKFLVVDNIIAPCFAFFGEYIDYKIKIAECYNLCFKYIDLNFDNLNTEIIYNFIKKENINADM